MFEKPQSRRAVILSGKGVPSFIAYDFSINGRPFIVVFYDAEQAKRLRNRKYWMTVSIVCFGREYLWYSWLSISAGNGVNLQRRPTSEHGEDGSKLHQPALLGTYFYFGN